MTDALREAVGKAATRAARADGHPGTAFLSELGRLGYAIVPREPTAAMVDAGVKFENWSNYRSVREIYAAMIAKVIDK